MRDIDGRGKPCPQPVLLTKKAADRGDERFRVIVDNEGSAQNVLRFVQNAGYSGALTVADGIWTVTASKVSGIGQPSPEPTPKPVTAAAPGGMRTLVIQGEYLGNGSVELGKRILAQLLSTLAVSERRPEYVVLMNGGAKLACVGSDALDSLRDLEAKGASVLVCGTCLNFFELNDKLQVGRPTNAYEALNLMLDGDTVFWG
ncbi:MAG: sulfurtransferase-like selenium metabolism protein YedF [Eubacteriales bacterium]|jgi:selenium metabolism protein YedF|nr:sulfurtransferase-like selenium metabolism protein YedF [Bacillota bacterium]MBV1726821.1 sulfurtransferase-like selenium metabolism protein YedF [Desulforudis sp.]MDP3051431.1 sulfurtransferase-like selenium metabolism protein YedF [Eubacteriales bacterium]MBV1735780.1 sulfurtransferase-like selenium metabolism protein YedF [Desulforudis sp.]MDZ4043033.1 sulfurtransferase-like selenium metabolism protein YedF [Eubacteriales bacterium]